MKLTPSLEKFPQLDMWLKFNVNGTIDVYSGKVELGQKITTSIAIIASEELDVDFNRINVGKVNTDYSPEESPTVGSNSIEESGESVRQASAAAKQILLEMASKILNESTDRLILNDGEIKSQTNDNLTSYWDLIGGKKFNHKISWKEGLVGAAAIDKTGDPYPIETHDVCLDSDAVLFGAVGDPKFDNDPSAKVRPEEGLLRMRKKLGLYANIRPTYTFDSLMDKSPIKRSIIEGTDLVFVRELTGGIYFGKRGRKDNNNFAFDTCEYSKEEIIRLAKIGFELSLKRSKKLCCIDKANVLESSRLWRETVQSMEKEYPDVQVSYEFVDAVAMRLIHNPSSYDVLITGNLFGDILTDEASVISGSMGLMPSASVGLKTSIYEPIHGSYPQAKGKNIANPLATILSASMMFEGSFGLIEESELIKQVVSDSITKKIVTGDLSGNDKFYSTEEVGSWICKRIEKG